MHFVPKPISEIVVSHSSILAREFGKSFIPHPTLEGFLNLCVLLSVFGISRFSFQLHLLLSFNHMHFVYSGVPHSFAVNKGKDQLSWFWFSDILIEEQIGHLFWWIANQSEFELRCWINTIKDFWFGSPCIVNFGRLVFRPVLGSAWGMTVSVFSFSIDVNKALLLLKGILLPDPAINISLALSHLACVLTLWEKERYYWKSLEDMAKQFRRGFHRSSLYLAFIWSPLFHRPNKPLRAAGDLQPSS